MAKSFKTFRQDYDDEWGDPKDRDFRKKDKKMKSRRDERKKKVHDKFSAFDDKVDDE